MGFTRSNHSLSSVPWGWLDIVTVVAVVISSLYLVQTFLRVATHWQLVSGDGNMTSPFVFVSITLIYGVLIGCIYWIAVRRGGWNALGIGPIPWGTVSLTPLLLIAELFGIIGTNHIVELLTGKPFENPQIDAISSGEPLTTMQLLMLLLLVVVLAPVAEELFFRGMLYPLLREWGSGIAIVGSALLFSLAHLMPVLFPSLFFVGLILGFLREQSNSTIPGIVLHMMQNGTMILLLHLSMH